MGSTTLSASRILELTPSRRDMTVNYTAQDTAISILLGEPSVAGRVGPIGYISGDLVIAVFWGYGEIEAIDTVYINDAPIPTAVTVTHYTGTIFQGVDPTLATAIPGFAEDFILSTPQGRVGIAYSVFRIPALAITAFPKFQAVIRGLKVDDPRPAEDPSYANTKLWVTYVKSQASSVDESPASRTLTFGTGVTVSGGYVTNSVVSQGVSFSGSIAFGTSDFCIEAKAKVDDSNSTGTFVIYRGNYSGSNPALAFGITGDKLGVVVYSSTTSSVVIFETDAGTVPSGGQEADIKLVRIGDVFSVYVNGIETWTTTQAANIPTTSSANFSCYSETTPVNTGGIRAMRITVGAGRYTDDHDSRGFPFSDCRRYTDNSALCWGEVVTNPIYGMGVFAFGLEESADWNDSLLGGAVERCKIGLALTTYKRTKDLLDLLATYAELYWYWDGPSIVAVPDAIVDPEDYYEETNCVAGSLQVNGTDDGNTPTKITIRYTDDGGASPYWPERSASSTLPGVDEGTRSLRESVVSMPGIKRLVEAENKALARLEKLNNQVSVSWITTDKGLIHRKGDVIHHNMTYRGTDILVRLLEVQLIAPGRWRVSGTSYSPSHYPSELSGVGGTIPVGAILPLSGNTVPDGWADWTLANGRYIVGAGGSYAAGATGGSETFAGWSGATSSNDSHEGASYETFATYKARVPSESGGTVSHERTTDADVTTPHSHTYAIGAFSPDLLRREQRLVIKTGSVDVEIPRQVMIFGLPTLQVAGLSRIVSSANRLLMASAATVDAGVSSKLINTETGSFNDAHRHVETSTDFSRDALFSASAIAYASETGGSEHSHFFVLPLTRNPKYRMVGLWGGSTSFPIVRGMMVLWASGSIPSGWALCNGSSGTPDLRDHFIKIAPIGSDGIGAGDNTLSLAGESTAVSHKHDGGGTSTPFELVQERHSNTISHRHSINLTASWTPQYYALSVIMKT